MNIKLMNKIAKVGTAVFDGRYTVGEDVAVPDAIMVRSAKLHEMPLNPELLAIARAGAGVNNIPVEKCAEAGVVVFNTPGANANAVKELAVCALLLASRGIVDGINWAKAVEDRANITKEVEAGKGAFAGCEIAGKTLGGIGLGAIGGMVANAANALGMQVIGYDPFLSVTNALHLSRAVTLASGYDEIFAKCDYITLHVPATKDTKGFINKAALAAMKNGVLAGFPVEHLKVTVIDGSFHPVDSDQLSFELCAIQAFKKASEKAGPVLLEPIMKIEVVTPEESMGDVIGDLNKRRGQVEGMETSRSGARVVKAKAPLAEMFGYVTALRTITSGRATSTMSFSHYAEVSSSIARNVLTECQGRVDLVK